MFADRPQVRELSGGRLHLSHGPIDVVLRAWGKPAAVSAAYRAAIRRFADILPELCSELPRLRAPVGSGEPPESPVGRRMAAACCPFADVFVTPMAAVAGSVADELMAVMLGAAALARAYVNDGGDIAVHCTRGAALDIGVAGGFGGGRLPQLNGSVRIRHGDGVGGIATSGARGRSFSLGIADSVTVLAADAATADAAATLVANAVDIEHPAIVRRPASALDPDSDLGDRLVTVSVGDLPRDIVLAALEAGRRRAAEYLRRGSIVDAVLMLQDEAVTLFDGNRNRWIHSARQPRRDSPPPCGDRGGGNHDLRCSGIPPTPGSSPGQALSLPHKGGGDAATRAAHNLELRHRCALIFAGERAEADAECRPVGDRRELAMKDDRTTSTAPRRTAVSRRAALAGLGAAGLATAAAQLGPGAMRYAQAQPSRPFKLGFQVHRTGIGAAYGRWYERTVRAAVTEINAKGGIAGRPVEIVAEDDGTDPKRGAEVVEKFATQHGVDIAFGTLFSHVVMGAAPRAGELKLPYYVVSEGYHVASGALNRYTFQPGITDVRSQVSSMAPWVADKLGKKVTMIFPDYAFGHDHRDYFSAAIKGQGGQVVELIPIPPTETSYTKYFPRIPSSTEVLYHVMVGPGVLTFVKELGEHFGQKRPQIFGFIDSLEAVALNSPGLDFLEGTYFWEGFPRYAQTNQTPYDKFYRQKVGVNDAGALAGDPKDVSTYSHMFGCWETLYIIKQAIEASGYQSPADKAKLIEATEAIAAIAASNEHPQGDKVFNGKMHQVFGHQNISVVEKGRLKVVHRTSIKDGLYENSTDYTKMAL
jgi:branched-chain amino acid transport system substrate-binding protein